MTHIGGGCIGDYREDGFYGVVFSFSAHPAGGDDQPVSLFIGRLSQFCGNAVAVVGEGGAGG